jgi:pantoate kinase
VLDVTSKAGALTMDAIKKSTKPLSIVFVSAEVAPWSKTGGLGDVVRARRGGARRRARDQPEQDCSVR